MPNFLRRSDAAVHVAIVRTAWALGLLGDKRAVNALEGILQDNDARVREAAAESLEKLTGQRYQLPGK